MKADKRALRPSLEKVHATNARIVSRIGLATGCIAFRTGSESIAQLLPVSSSVDRCREGIAVVLEFGAIRELTGWSSEVKRETPQVLAHVERTMPSVSA